MFVSCLGLYFVSVCVLCLSVREAVVELFLGDGKAGIGSQQVSTIVDVLRDASLLLALWFSLSVTLDLFNFTRSSFEFFFFLYTAFVVGQGP